MVSARRGRGRIGCLVTLLFLAAIAYFGANIGEVYLRYFRFRDAMDQEARYAARHDDAEIVSRLRAFADSIGLPEGAGQIRVRRTANHISISTEYYDRVEVPLYVHEIHFAPHVEWTF